MHFFSYIIIGVFMKQLKVIFAIIATLIGAGFASGQEIKKFFYIYGIKGISGLAVCCIFFAIIIYKVFVITNCYNIESYKDLVKLLFETHSIIVNIIVNLFLLITFFIMVAGFGAFFSQEIGISKYVGSGVLACLCFCTFVTNTDSVLKVSSLLVPLLILFIVLIGFINLNSIDTSFVLSMLKNLNVKSYSWLLSCILYVSYNSILLIPVLITLGKHVNSKSSILVVAIFSSLILFILAISIFLMLTKVNVSLNGLEMPILYIIRHFYKSFMHIYAFVILSSIYTTAISIGMSFIDNITTTIKTSYSLIVLIMCITSFGISGFGFSNLVANLYPFFGYLGIVQIWLLLKIHPQKDELSKGTG